MSSESSVVSATSAAVIVITLNRPDSMNAIDESLALGLRRAIDDAASTPACRAVVLRGAGTSFCAGGDVAAMYAERDDLPGVVERLIDAFHASVMALGRLPVPIVACVKGAVAGGGFSLALACDLVVAARSTRFVVAYPRLGAPADGGLSFRLPERLGRVQGFEMLTLKGGMNAEQALALRLINRIADDDEVEAEALRCAEGLAAMPAQSVNELKQLVAAQSRDALEAHLAREKAAFLRCAATPDFAARVAAFVRKTHGTA